MEAFWYRVDDSSENCVQRMLDHFRLYIINFTWQYSTIIMLLILDLFFFIRPLFNVKANTAHPIPSAAVVFSVRQIIAVYYESFLSTKRDKGSSSVTGSLICDKIETTPSEWKDRIYLLNKTLDALANECYIK